MVPHLLALALLASPAARSYVPDSAGTGRDFDEPPTAAVGDDLALWRAAHDIDNDLVVEQHEAARAAVHAKANQQRLEDAVARASLTAERSAEIARPVEEKWLANVELMQSVWPVSKVRVCRYELLNFEGVLMSNPSSARAGQLDASRRDLAECVAKATTVLNALRQSNEELRAASQAVERALAPPAKSTAAATEPAPKP